MEYALGESADKWSGSAAKVLLSPLLQRGSVPKAPGGLPAVGTSQRLRTTLENVSGVLFKRAPALCSLRQRGETESSHAGGSHPTSFGTQRRSILGLEQPSAAVPYAPFSKDRGGDADCHWSEIEGDILKAGRQGRIHTAVRIQPAAFRGASRSCSSPGCSFSFPPGDVVDVGRDELALSRFGLLVENLDFVRGTRRHNVECDANARIER